MRLLSQCAGIAHLVERHLAKVEVASSSLVARSKAKQDIQVGCPVRLSRNPVAQLGGNRVFSTYSGK